MLVCVCLRVCVRTHTIGTLGGGGTIEASPSIWAPVCKQAMHDACTAPDALCQRCAASPPFPPNTRIHSPSHPPQAHAQGMHALTAHALNGHSTSQSVEVGIPAGSSVNIPYNYCMLHVGGKVQMRSHAGRLANEGVRQSMLHRPATTGLTKSRGTAA